MTTITTPLLLGLFLVTAPLAAQEPPTPVKVDPVRTQPMSQTVPVLGRLVALQSGVVAARAEGPVAEVRVQVGDHVAQGQVLAVLDQARLRAVVSRREAELRELEARRATAEARERLARLELARLEKLRGSAAFNRALYDTRVQELDVARGSLREAEARIQSGRAELELARIELADATIRAPYAGAVTQRQAVEGAWLKVGDPVVTLVNDADLEIEADVPADRLDGLGPGQTVTVFPEGSPERYLARVRAVIPQENPAARTRPVRLVPEFPASRARLAANQPVTLLIPAGGTGEVTSVHKDAVLRKGGQALVFVVEEGAARPRPVLLGQAVGDRFQVLDGLQPGELVVVRGNERLRPGQAVSFELPDGTEVGSRG